MATGGVACRVCGAVSPSGFRCPACGARTGRGRRLAGVAASMVAVAILGAWLCVRYWPSGSDPALAARVRAGSGGFRLSANQKRTDVSGFVDNDGAVPVDVTVRVRGIDWGDRVVAEVEVGPIRDLKPGGSAPIRATFDMTPLKSTTVDVARVVRSRP